MALHWSSYADIGRLVSSLGQAVRCVSLNHEELTREQVGTKWDAIGVLDAAGDGLTLIGESRVTGDGDDGRQPVRGPQRRSDRVCPKRLTQTIANLRAGRWSYKAEPDMDISVADRMQHDLAVLPVP